MTAWRRLPADRKTMLAADSNTSSACPNPTGYPPLCPICRAYRNVGKVNCRQTRYELHLAIAVHISTGWPRPGAGGRRYPAVASLHLLADRPVRRRRRNHPGSPQLTRSCEQPCRGPPFETLTAQSRPDGPGGPLTGSRAATLPRGGHLDGPDIFPHVGTVTRPTGAPLGTIVTAERYALSARSIMRAGTRVYRQRCLPAHYPQFTLTSAERRGPAIRWLPGSHFRLIPFGSRFDTYSVSPSRPSARRSPRLPDPGSGDIVPGSAESRGLRACAQGVRQSPRPW